MAQTHSQSKNHSHHRHTGEEAPELRSREARKVTVVGSLVNLVLTGLKFLAGIFGGSTAIVADAVHSLSDLATDLVVIISLRFTSKPRDSSHDYGHGKFETFGTMVIGVSLVAVALGIGWEGLNRTLAVFLDGAQLEQPGLVALVAAALSIAAKEVLYQWTILVGKRINSPAVIANAWHHRSDALSSVGAFLGIGGAILLDENWRVLDPLAGVLVSVLILKVGLGIAWESINELLEKSLSEGEKARILELIASVDGAQDPHNLRTRRVGSEISLEVHVRVDARKNITQGHDIATEIEQVLRREYGSGTMISVHIEPASS